jgi:hypothetical protein
MADDTCHLMTHVTCAWLMTHVTCAWLMAHARCLHMLHEHGPMQHAVPVLWLMYEACACNILWYGSCNMRCLHAALWLMRHAVPIVWRIHACLIKYGSCKMRCPCLIPKRLEERHVRETCKRHVMCLCLI